MTRGTSADHSPRRRRVIIMQSDGKLEPSAAEPPTPRDSEPTRLPDSDLPQSLLGEFRRACGQTVPLLIRVSSSEFPSRTQTLLWDRPSLIIGRGLECDLRLCHAEVSRQHAYLQIVGGRVHCADLGSATGTYWAHGQNARQHGMLDFGEPVSIGPYSLTIEEAPQHGTFENAADSIRTGESLPDGQFLDFREGDQSPRRWPATRDVTVIGGGACAKVKLLHPTVSKAHCAIVRAGHVLWVIDLLSEEGTLVNGELITTARLDLGDEMRIGPFDVAVHYGSPLDDESIHFSSGDSNLPAHRPDGPQTKAMTEFQPQTAAAAKQTAGGGVSEQFVLDVINQLGAMQQQALQQARQSMVEAVQAVSATYQGRIETLEKEHESLKRQLRGLPGPVPSEADPAEMPPGLPEFASDFVPLTPLPPGMVEPEYQDLPKPEKGSFECEDPEVREQWLRQKMKLVEAELDKTRTGWGKKLIDLMGY